MTKKTCPVCGAKNSLVKETKEFTVRYEATELIRTAPVLTCSCCGSIGKSYRCFPRGFLKGTSRNFSF